MTAALFSLVTGCSAFVGSQAPRDGAVDADLARDGASDASTRDVLALDAEATDALDADPGALVCGTVDAPCDPFTDRGCEGGLRCFVTSLLPPSFACLPSGARRLGESCVATTPAMACGAGLQCINDRCLPLCCPGDHTPCRARSPRSACAVLTDSTRLMGCTVPGECAWEPTDTCAEGTQCFPQGAFGEAVCRPFGSVALDGRCTAQNECARGLTCLGGGVSFGRCRPVCNPRGAPSCEAGLCTLFNDRPNNYGACRP